MAIRRVNRIALDGSTVTIAFGRYVIPVLKMSYGDKLETGTLSNMGEQSIAARTPGTYSTIDPKVSIEAVVFRAQLYPLLGKNGFGSDQFPMTVNYGHPALGSDSDLLDGVRIVAPAFDTENSNKAFEIEFGLVFDQLYLGSARKTLNIVNPTIAIGGSAF